MRINVIAGRRDPGDGCPFSRSAQQFGSGLRKFALLAPSPRPSAAGTPRRVRVRGGVSRPINHPPDHHVDEIFPFHRE